MLKFDVFYCLYYIRLLQSFALKEMKQMSTNANDDYWLKLINQCRSSDLVDCQWCIENGIFANTFYYYVWNFHKRACEISKVVDFPSQEQKVVQILLWERVWPKIFCLLRAGLVRRFVRCSKILPDHRLHQHKDASVEKIFKKLALSTWQC